MFEKLSLLQSVPASGADNGCPPHCLEGWGASALGTKARTQGGKVTGASASPTSFHQPDLPGPKSSKRRLIDRVHTHSFIPFFFIHSFNR